MKRLYIIAGGTDGYVNIQYTFDRQLAQDTVDNDPEAYGDEGCVDWILVPDEMTYECLGINYPLEDDE